MTIAPADRPCGCEQSQDLIQDLADARSQLEAHAEDNRELFEQLAAANARVAELEKRVQPAEARLVPLVCLHPDCSSAAAFEDSPPPRSPVASDWWCAEHALLHLTPLGWARTGCQWNLERGGAAAELAALRSRLDPGVPENVRRVARALESSFRERHTILADGCWFEDAAAALKAALSGGG